MKVLGVSVLDDYKLKHANVRAALSTWLVNAKNANWKCPQDVKNDDPKASILANNRVIFNIKGNHYRLLVRARYVQSILQVEWIGTHAEYDKQDFSGD